MPGTGLKPAPTPLVHEEQPIVAAHRSYLRLEFWLQATDDYPQQDFDEAKRAVASAIDGLVQPNSDGAAVQISLITSNSWSPDSTVMTSVIPAIPADPQPPVLQAMPTPTGDPFTDSQNKQQVDDANTALLASYQQVLSQYHRVLAQLRARIRQQTDMLRALNPTRDSGPVDLWGMFSRAAQRLQGGRSPKYLFIAGSLENTTWQEFIPGSALWGTKVRVIWHYCQDAPTCAANSAFWQGAFSHAGATDVRIYDPAQSRALQSLLA